VRSAGEFGLSSHEVWEIVMATPDRLPTDLRARYIDELTGELARRLLEKQHDSQRGLRPIHHGRIPPRSPLIRTDAPRATRRIGLARRWLDWAGRRRKRAATPTSASGA
jgi:hypothetical protein